LEPFNQMQVFAIPELSGEIFQRIPDIRVMRVCTELDHIVRCHPEYQFWAGYAPGDLFRYGKVKMLSAGQVTVTRERLNLTCSHGNLEMVRYLAGKFPRLIKVETLIIAASRGPAEAVSVLTAAVGFSSNLLEYAALCAHVHGHQTGSATCSLAMGEILNYVLKTDDMTMFKWLLGKGLQFDLADVHHLYLWLRKDIKISRRDWGQPVFDTPGLANTTQRGRR
jgi:hypothetical protein